jgi:spore germination protein YaaH
MNKAISTILLVGLLFSSTTALAFEQNFYSYSESGAVDSINKQADEIDTLLPQSYIFTRGFQLQRVDDGGAEQVANDQNIDIIPLIHQQNFDRVLMSAILYIETIQKILVKSLIKEAQDQGYAGWQFDFENITPIEKDLYTEFVEYAAGEFDRADLELSVAVVPRQSEYREGVDDPDWSVAYDLEAIADVVDHVVLMAYDDPRSMGPAASVNYTRQTIQHALTKAPADKLSLGIPLYCWKWYVNDGYRKRGAISHPLTDEDFDESLGGIRGYSEVLESEWSLYRVNSGNLYLTWCDGPQGFAAKLNLIKEYNLRGFSAWAIGQEDDGIWQEL